MERVHYTGAEYICVAENQAVRLLAGLACRTRQDVLSVIII